MDAADPRDKRIAELEARIAELEKLLAAALAENAELRARLGMNSSNSSKPPSTDPPGVERPKKERSKRKRGAQPGHEAHLRPLVPPEKVDKTVDLRPPACDGCGDKLSGDDPDPRRHQVFDLVRILLFIVEYRLHALLCRKCGVVTRARLPDGVPQGILGPRLLALTASLTGRFLLSKRLVVEFFSDILGIDICVGSVCKAERFVSETLAEPTEEAAVHVREQRDAHLDETGWREDKHRAWLWIATTALVAVFKIARSRGGDVARELLKGFSGFVHSDRWSGYAWVDVSRRQLCWAHLIRDFQGMVDRGGRGAKIGQALLDEGNRMFQWWPRVRDGTLSRSAFYLRMRAVERRVGELLREGAVCAEGKTKGMCDAILKLEPALWTFVSSPGLDPTNNLAEQDIRRAVLWRKGSFGTDSATGSRYVERVLTVVMTLRKQGKNVHEYLARACEARLRGERAPSILPAEHDQPLQFAA